MESNIYALYDKKLERYMTPPLFVRDDKEAVAIVVRSLPKNILDDCMLELIAKFDDKTATIDFVSRKLVPFVSEVKEDASN